jgi:hypothetical protein
VCVYPISRLTLTHHLFTVTNLINPPRSDKLTGSKATKYHFDIFSMGVLHSQKFKPLLQSHMEIHCIRERVLYLIIALLSVVIVVGANSVIAGNYDSSEAAVVSSIAYNDKVAETYDFRFGQNPFSPSNATTSTTFKHCCGKLKLEPTIS